MGSNNYTGAERPTPMAFDEAMKSLRGSLNTMPTPADVEEAFTTTALLCLDSIRKGVMGTVVPTRRLNALCIGMEAATAHAAQLTRAVQHDVPATIASIMHACGVTDVTITNADIDALATSGKVLRGVIDPRTMALTYMLVDADAPADTGLAS